MFCWPVFFIRPLNGHDSEYKWATTKMHWIKCYSYTFIIQLDRADGHYFSVLHSKHRNERAARNHSHRTKHFACKQKKQKKKQLKLHKYKMLVYEYLSGEHISRTSPSTKEMYVAYDKRVSCALFVVALQNSTCFSVHKRNRTTP